MTDNRTFADYHATTLSGNDCPDDSEGRHYFAFIEPPHERRVCIDCGAPEERKS